MAHVTWCPWTVALLDNSGTYNTCTFCKHVTSYHVLDKWTKWRQITIKLQGQRYLKYVLQVYLEPHISISLALRAAVLELQAPLRQVHQTIQKWPWRLLGQRYPICVLLQLGLPNLKFHSMISYFQNFFTMFHFPTDHNVASILFFKLLKFWI